MPKINELPLVFPVPLMEHLIPAMLPDEVGLDAEEGETVSISLDQLRVLMAAVLLGGDEEFADTYAADKAALDAAIDGLLDDVGDLNLFKLNIADFTTKLMSEMAAATVGVPAAADKFMWRTVAGLLRTQAYSDLRLSMYPPGTIYGLQTSNDPGDVANDIAVGAGYARDSTDVDTLFLSVAMTKRVDAVWAAGNNSGGRMSAAALANGTTYHIFIIKNPTTGAVDWGFDVSPTAPTLPAGFTLFRRIWSVIYMTATFAQYIQTGDECLWKTIFGDINANAPGNAAVLRSITVPNGLKVLAHIIAQKTGGGSGAGNDTYISSPDQTDDFVTVQLGFSDSSVLFSAHTTLQIRTNLSSQIRSRTNQGGAGTNLKIFTTGYVDTRGRFI